MPVITTTPTIPDIRRHVHASVLATLTEHLTMDRVQVAGCLEGSGEDLKIASRVAIVVIARVQKVFGLKDLVDPKKLRPEQVASIRSVTELVIQKLQEHLR
jgi:hypothetical protein